MTSTGGMYSGPCVVVLPRPLGTVVRGRGEVIRTSAGVVPLVLVTWLSDGIVTLLVGRVLIGTVRLGILLIGDSVTIADVLSGVTRTRVLVALVAVRVGAAVVDNFGRFVVSILSSQTGRSHSPRQSCKKVENLK